MPTLNLFTNVPVDAVIASDILRDATKAVAKIIGKPERVCWNVSHITWSCSIYAGYKTPVSLSLIPRGMCSNVSHIAFSCPYEAQILQIRRRIRIYVMIVLNGAVPVAFAGTEEPAAYGELISIGGLGPSVNGKLSSTIADILQTKLSIDCSRFYIKFYDVQRSFFGFNGSTF
ncbi:hypothetical protein TEA_027012 [Camellia sinensis var. sinensis]|uniref:L-dopachrome isomerase n=1 Tax=Camellia sinensis var. sinensis TaxID=542762 RepID=A0A4S4ELX5_CAMSN|nr:hypothetical protein TEA_027012 [Camellia sinensis var. sinensis]